jgi:D-ribitol-5-phosphate cytidylyltransferase
MNYALIFAGGVGQRMNSQSLPKQFLEVHGKPIIVHTLEHFQNHPSIDKIIVVCLESYIKYMETLINQFHLSKVISVVPGGSCGQDSIFNGLKEMKKVAKEDDIVLIHDGVRPIIDEKTISDNIQCVKKNKTAITVCRANETILLLNESGVVDEVVDRSKCNLGRAPQSFFFKDIYESHLKAISLNKHDFIDSAMLMQFFGYKMFTVVGPVENIKITTPLDFFLFRAILDAKENEQIKVL